MIEVRGLTKRYGRVLAVDALSFEIRPGIETGFLGPNGSGKSTTMRIMLGLDAPDRGMVRIGGRRYGELGWPLREVGALLEARAFHPGRSALAQLAALAASSNIPASTRVPRFRRLANGRPGPGISGLESGRAQTSSRPVIGWRVRVRTRTYQAAGVGTHAEPFLPGAVSRELAARRRLDPVRLMEGPGRALAPRSVYQLS
jgi:ABC-type sugar transport system ATPase subunit